MVSNDLPVKPKAKAWVYSPASDFTLYSSEGHCVLIQFNKQLTVNI